MENLIPERIKGASPPAQIAILFRVLQSLNAINCNPNPIRLDTSLLHDDVVVVLYGRLIATLW